MPPFPTVNNSALQLSKYIRELRKLFAAYGLPEQLVSDNGPQFTSSDFAMFLKQNGVKHVRSAPYHPSSNGAAERFVQTFKRAMKQNELHGVPSQKQLPAFLLSYRTASHATTGQSPCLLFLNRQVRTRLDLIHPNLREHVSGKQLKQKHYHDQHAHSRELYLGQRVMAQGPPPQLQWLPGTIIQQTGPVSYVIKITDGRLWKRHAGLIQPSDSRNAHLAS